jgi:flagellin
MAMSIKGSDAVSSIQRSLNKSLSELNKSNERLASGKRINRASDDAAGAQIVAQLEAESAISRTATNNVSYGASLANIAEGAYEQAGNITGRMSELAAQASNGTLSDAQRSALDNEFQALSAELDRVSATTTFNGQAVLGSSNDIQVGTDSSANSKIAVNIGAVTSSSLGLSGASLTSQAGAQAALDLAKSANQSVASSRADIGAAENRLSVALSNLETSIVNNEEAASRIRDADISKEAAERVGYDIRAKASVALQAQANITSSSNIMRLLQGT